MALMTRHWIGPLFTLTVLTVNLAGAQNAPRPPLPPMPAPAGVPKPGPSTDAPYVPLPILQGGVVIPLYPPGSPYLKM
jgi:hypothetical protein